MYSAEGPRGIPCAHLVDVVDGVAHVGVELLGELLQHAQRMSSETHVVRVSFEV